MICPSHVLWDEDRINEVLGNLLSNAFKFTDRGRHSRAGGGRVGQRGLHLPCAIPARVFLPEQLPHIFEKFFQASNQAYAAAKGTGLGLAIAREIVEAHGGTIKVDSSPRR